MPLIAWLCLVGLAVSLAMTTAIVLASKEPGRRIPFLALVFLEAAAFFLASIVGGAPRGAFASAALSYCGSLLGLPSLYLYGKSMVERIGRKAWVHYLPTLVNLPLGLGVALLAATGKGGLLEAAYYTALSVAQTVQLAFYGRAALSLARDYGRAGRWPLRIARAVLAAYSLIVALGWIIIVAALAEEIIGYDIEIASWIDPLSVMTAVFLAWTLGLCLIWGRGQAAAGEARKYGGRPLPEEEAASLVRRVRAALEAEGDLGSDAAQPRSLAERLGVPYYLLSRAVNEREGMSILELANEYRVERAKAILARSPGTSVMDACLEAGFQAKSTFNEAFRKSVGMTPREYRLAARAGGLPSPGRS